MPYPISSDVSPAQPTLSAQYNNLRADALRLGQASADVVDLATFFKRYISGVSLVYLATNRIRAVYNASYPPTIMINGLMVQANANVDLPAGMFTGAAATYYIFANHAAGSSSFTLSVNTSFTEGADQRLIGSAYWNGASVTNVTTYPYNPTGLPPADYDSGYFACVYNTTYTKSHGFGAIPRLLVLLHSNAADGSGEIVPTVVVRDSASVYTTVVGFGPDNVDITTGADSAAGTLFSKRSVSASGYYRILAWK